MTTEELIAVGLPVEPIVEGPENAPPAEDEGSPAASGSRSHEDGEVRTDDKDVGDVDAGIGDLVKAKAVGPLPPSLVFGESKLTANMIREYEAAGFFPSGIGRAPLDEQIPAPEDGEIVVLQDFFICGLRFPCDPILPAILDAFSVKIHQLSPTSFLEVSKFIWIMKTLAITSALTPLPDSSNWSSFPMLSRSTMGNSTKLSTHAVPSTPSAKTPEKGLREFISLPAARPISPTTGIRTGFT
jgi:hypothetical protein